MKKNFCNYNNVLNYFLKMALVYIMSVLKIQNFQYFDIVYLILISLHDR